MCFLHDKGNYKQGEKTAFGMGENNSKWSNWQTTNLKNIQATHAAQSEWLRPKSLQAINAGEGVEKREPSYTVGGNAN